MGKATVSSITRRMTWEEWHLGQIVQLHALLAKDLGNGSVDALSASLNWRTVFAMTANQPLPVEQRHAEELAVGIGTLARTWDEYRKRQPPTDDVSEKDKVERERQRQQALEREREMRGKWDAMTLQDVWPVLVKASLQRRHDPEKWRILAGLISALSEAGV